MSGGFLGFLKSQFFVNLPKPSLPCTGKTIIVTGSNTGLGKEAARHFTKLGASTVILAVRSVEKGEAAKADIESSTGVKNVVKVWQLDMSSYQSVQDFAAKVDKELPRLDIAVLNAGIATGKFVIAEKDESTITVNVVSTFLLSLLLLPKLKKTAQTFNVRPNLTIVSSEVHFWSKFTEKSAPEGGLFAEMSKDAKMKMSGRYELSKLLEVFTIRAMTDIKSAGQIPVTINTVNPGFCHSELGREGGIGFYLMQLVLARSTEQGSRTLVHAATQGAETHGQYMSDCQITLPAALVLSAEGHVLQRRVWEELSAKLEAIKKGVVGNL
ncbi:short-chain dehydrogenase/reductase-like protein [Melanomma pulvis-pyrius CBS 109.77]|uniref:Short-chain dehydrogenase/reductase-like protein n=1 Tax=Melanomma pulvis-pyrius CBS 109.77 TaxID=1314802 RepID=A0A6A6WSY3_9PLEO|nr:short-chain dehydrogenase/reductase-like protein [Melanomma pulvis-pyrius CBS 109.77]